MVNENSPSFLERWFLKILQVFVSKGPNRLVTGEDSPQHEEEGSWMKVVRMPQDVWILDGAWNPVVSVDPFQCLTRGWSSSDRKLLEYNIILR